MGVVPPAFLLDLALPQMQRLRVIGERGRFGEETLKAMASANELLTAARWRGAEPSANLASASLAKRLTATSICCLWALAKSSISARAGSGRLLSRHLNCAKGKV